MPSLPRPPFSDLEGYNSAKLRRDLWSALAVTFIAVPQGVAYALIAGLPTAMGLYAAALPALAGSLLRSSPHVITGPTNAVSLLVGGIVAAQSDSDPATVAITLAAMVGVLQIAAGALRLGIVVDYISSPVVLGYITGAGTLIVVGQLENITGTVGAHGGDVFHQVLVWAQNVHGASWHSVGVSLLTVALVVVLRKLVPKAPASVVALLLGITASYLFDFQAEGVATIASIPSGLPGLTTPDLSLVQALVGGAMACTLLSLVEASSVARATASRTGHYLSTSTEFIGQGAANVIAGLTGGFPTSGSPTRTMLNEARGSTRLAGVLAGLMMLAVLVVAGPVLEFTPIASLAGILLVIAGRLVRPKSILTTLKATRSDASAFLVTLVGTWVLPLHQAVLLGVGISIVLYLRRARLLNIQEMTFDGTGHLREVDRADEDAPHCGVVRVMHVEGALFFGAAGELQHALAPIAQDPSVKVLILRLKRVQSLDLSCLQVLGSIAKRLKARDSTLILAGMRPRAVQLLEQTSIADIVGHDNLFPSERTWFAAMEHAVDRAAELTDGQHSQACPFFARGEQSATAS